MANNDPSACYPSAVLALGATIKTDRRSIPADEYFQGMFTTALEPGELITAIEFPIPAKAAYQKFRNPASRYAMVGVFVAKGPSRRARGRSPGPARAACSAIPRWSRRWRRTGRRTRWPASRRRPTT